MNNDTYTLQFHIDTSNSNNIHFEVIRFYVSGIQLKFDDGQSFRDTTAHLVDLDKPSTQTILIPSGIHSAVTSLSYYIGTDSVTNVSGVLEGDLDPILGMYWAWNSGYINIKVEGYKKEDEKTVPFEYHLGGYNGEQATIQTVSHFPTKKNESQINIRVNPAQFIDQSSSITSVMIPGKTAVLLSRKFQHIFSLIE